MGQVAYAFEVHKSGSIDSLILNLQRAKNDPRVQRIVAVSDQTSLDRIRKESEGLGGDLKRYLVYFYVRSLIRVSELLTEVNELLRELRLTAS